MNSNTISGAEPGADAPVLRIREPGDLVAVVPRLLGFLPHDSLVILLLGGADIVMAARIDLDTVLTASPADLFTDLLWHGQTHGADRAITLTYAPRRLALRAKGVVRRGVGGWLDLALVVDLQEGRWWDADAPLDDLGRPVEGDDRIEAWADELALGDVAPARDRLLDGLKPPVGAREDELTGLWTDVAARLKTGTQVERDELMRRFAARPDAGWTAADLVTAAILVHDGPARDVLWSEVTRHSARRHLGFWSEVVRHTPLERRVVPLAVVGILAWQAGDGALMALCQEECHRLNPHAEVVDLLTELVQRGAHPDMWAQSIAASPPQALRPVAQRPSRLRTRPTPIGLARTAPIGPADTHTSKPTPIGLARSAPTGPADSFTSRPTPIGVARSAGTGIARPAPTGPADSGAPRLALVTD
jgi:hypothetical protein